MYDINLSKLVLSIQGLYIYDIARKFIRQLLYPLNDLLNVQSNFPLTIQSLKNLKVIVQGPYGKHEDVTSILLCS